jgi:putative membrane protein insertion efficiency factor
MVLKERMTSRRGDSAGPGARLLIAMVRLYQRSSWAPAPPCPFIPSCSEYSVRALHKYGAVKGSVLTVRRVRKCRPEYTGPYTDFP